MFAMSFVLNIPPIFGKSSDKKSTRLVLSFVTHFTLYVRLTELVVRVGFEGRRVSTEDTGK